MLSFLHPVSRTSGDITARKFLGWDAAGVLTSQEKRLAQLSAWAKLPAFPLKRGAAAGESPSSGARASVQG